MNRNFLNQHECEAANLTCMDFRFHEDLLRYIRQDMGISDFDLLAMAGGIKYLVDGGSGKETILKCFKISKNLHHVKKIALVNHVDCGAYGGSGAFKSREEEIEFHKDQLIRAKNLIKTEKDLADMEIILLFVNEKDGKPDYLMI